MDLHEAAILAAAKAADSAGVVHVEVTAGSDAALAQAPAATDNVLMRGGLVPALEHHSQMEWTSGGVHSPYMAICMAVKDQHDSMVEWVEHHRSVGVGKTLTGLMYSDGRHAHSNFDELRN